MKEERRLYHLLRAYRERVLIDIAIVPKWAMTGGYLSLQVTRGTEMTKNRSDT